MSDLDGWIGSDSELLYYLQVVGADRDEEGKFKVAGNITSFLGMGKEFVVGPDACYFVQGRPVPLAAGLRATSYGVKIQVL
jgi:hypothetical protein